jgi:uncharacterized protein (AIM24 family)
LISVAKNQLPSDENTGMTQANPGLKFCEPEAPMRATIHGTTLPVLEIDLARGERVLSETGELSWKTPRITMRTTTGAGGGGFMGALGRAVSGGGLFMTEYVAEHGDGQVAFAARIPGAIVPVELRPGQSYLIHKHGFLCGTAGTQLSIGLQRRIAAGILGGNGFILQKVEGDGQFWVELGGEVVRKTLGPGDVMQVHPAHVGMFEQSVSFDITTVPGIKNLFFGGDGFFLAELKGPGTVWLQTLTLPNLAHALAPYLQRS